MTTSTLQEMMFPMYNNSTMTEMVVPAAKYGMVKAESGLTYAHHHNNLPGVSRKRSREDSNNSINMNHQFVPFTTPTENLYNNSGNNNNHYSSNLFSFLGQDFSSQIQLDQLEVDRCISHHMEKVRLEMEERRRKCSRNIMAVVEESISKKLKAKEEEILKIEKLNSALVDRVKSLYVENQLWRDLAQSNEATATALRTNLEQVLTQVRDHHHHHQPYPGSVELIDDAQSCCGSNYDEGGERRNLADNVVENNCSVNGKINSKRCRSCGKEEACVLVLPCRHLCLCSGCDSYVHICPVCESNKSCSLHVNLTT
ncbi:hypothetical protein LIER_03997 [Lithospermum erythrorhizon]|uniref:RING-type domain-containing protein n=1 Tax=Lithospermum erythrorhizon TaxID=34254 RepID=A0AAV3NWC0_LITER